MSPVRGLSLHRVFRCFPIYEVPNLFDHMRLRSASSDLPLVPPCMLRRVETKPSPLRVRHHMYLSARSTCAAHRARFHDSVLLFQNNPSPYSPTNTGDVASIVFFLTWQMDFATSFRCLGTSIGSMNSGRAARMDQSDQSIKTREREGVMD